MDVLLRYNNALDICHLKKHHRKVLELTIKMRRKSCVCLKAAIIFLFVYLVKMNGAYLVFPCMLGSAPMNETETEPGFYKIILSSTTVSQLLSKTSKLIKLKT